MDKNQGPDGQKTIKTKKLRALTNRTKKSCSDNFFFRTKGHLPPSRIWPEIPPVISGLYSPWYNNCVYNKNSNFQMQQTAF